VETLRRQLQDKQSLESRLIGRSPAMEKVRRMIADLADTSANVLILGETGTGKELVARCLHEISRRQKHNFVAVNCGGLAENLFESEIFGHEAHAFTGAAKRRIGRIEYANNGTLFLDEIESMPLPCKSRCCACCRNARWSGWVPTPPFRWTAGYFRHQGRPEGHGQ
jgi:DNA-binding NtrC family response regulator